MRSTNSLILINNNICVKVFNWAIIQYNTVHHICMNNNKIYHGERNDTEYTYEDTKYIQNIILI